MIVGNSESSEFEKRKDAKNQKIQNKKDSDFDPYFECQMFILVCLFSVVS